MTALAQHKQIRLLEEKVHEVYEHQRNDKFLGRFVATETTIEAVAHELKLHRYPCANTFQDVIPPPTGYELLEEAVFFAVKHAFTHHYQLVPRFRNRTWYLHCDHMPEDAIDKINIQELKERLRETWVDQTVRERCRFTLKVDHTGGKYSVIPTSDSVHNHSPSCHPIAHIDSFESLFNVYFRTLYSCDDSINEARVTAGEAPLYGPFQVIAAWKSFPDLRIKGTTPVKAVVKLLHSPHLRGALQYSVDSPGSIFFAHVEGYRYWKTYPEVVLFTEDQKYVIDGQEWVLMMFHGVDSGNREFPICACLTEEEGNKAQFWALMQYQRMLKDYGLPDPVYVLAETDNDFVSKCRHMFPKARVHIDTTLRVKNAESLASKVFKNKLDREKAMKMWSDIVTSTEIITPEPCSPEMTRFLNEDTYFLRLLSDTPFLVKDMDFYRLRYFDPLDPDLSPNKFEMVRHFLKGFVSQYEYIDKAHGYLFSLTQNGFGAFYDNVQHWISETALAAVRDGHASKGPSGVPSAEDVKEIRKQGRKLAVDDFHPRWRNIYTSLHDVPLRGGKFHVFWKPLKQTFGMGFFNTDFKGRRCDTNVS